MSVHWGIQMQLPVLPLRLEYRWEHCYINDVWETESLPQMAVAFRADREESLSIRTAGDTQCI